MNILVVDPIIYGGQIIAQRLVTDGHNVVHAPILGAYAEDPYLRFAGLGLKGIKTDPDGWMRWIDWADAAVVTGSEHRGHVVKYLRDQGVPTVGPGPKEGLIEYDRAVGYDLAREAKVSVPWQKAFQTLDEAIAYIKRNPDKYVLKFDQSIRDIAETKVAEDPKGQDLIRTLEDLKPKLSFAVQRFNVYLQEILNGHEVSVAGWFNGKKFVGDELFLCYEGTGNGFVYDLRAESLSLIDKIIDREALAKALQSIKFKGPFDLNGRLVDNKLYFLEWTPRFGGGITGFFCHAVENLGELIHATGLGSDTKVLRDSVLGNITFIININDDNEPGPVVKDIIFRGGKSLPVFGKNASFWAELVTKTQDGRLVVLPTGDSFFDKTHGFYVGTGLDLSRAVSSVESLMDEVTISGTYVEIASEIDDLKERVKLAPTLFPKEEWITNIARSMNHVYQSPLKYRY